MHSAPSSTCTTSRRSCPPITGGWCISMTTRCFSPTPRTRRSTSASTSKSSNDGSQHSPHPNHLIAEHTMYEKDGQKYFIVDAHIALWDARPENQRNIHGKQFIDCFYDY